MVRPNRRNCENAKRGEGAKTDRFYEEARKPGKRSSCVPGFLVGCLFLLFSRLRFVSSFRGSSGLWTDTFIGRSGLQLNINCNTGLHDRGVRHGSSTAATAAGRGEAMAGIFRGEAVRAVRAAD